MLLPPHLAAGHAAHWVLLCIVWWQLWVWLADVQGMLLHVVQGCPPQPCCSPISWMPTLLCCSW